MGVYIKGMEMPRSCMLCPLCVEEADPASGEMCMVTGTLMPPCTRERLDNCPLVPVPKHGRFIDADALTISTAVPLDGKPYRYIHIDNIENAPTIIPADEEKYV